MMFFLLFLVQYATFAVAVTLTSIANSSATTTVSPVTSPPTVNATGSFCCQVFFNSVRLNVWYTSSLEYIKDTVVTEYAQYSNTVVPSVTRTVPNNASNTISYGTRIDVMADQYTFTSIPNIIGFDDEGYDGTAVDSTTVWANNWTTPIASPTPFATMLSFWAYSGTADGTDCIVQTITPGSTVTYPAFTATYPPVTESLSGSLTTFSGTTSTQSIATTTIAPVTSTLDSNDIFALFIVPDDEYDPVLHRLYVNQPFVYLPGLESIHDWTYGGTTRFLNTPQELLDWLKSQPEVLSQFPPIGQCSGAGGLGAPTLHIPVAESTVSSAITIPVGGNFGTGGSGGYVGGNDGGSGGDDGGGNGGGNGGGSGWSSGGDGGNGGGSGTTLKSGDASSPPISPTPGPPAPVTRPSTVELTTQPILTLPISLTAQEHLSESSPLTEANTIEPALQPDQDESSSPEATPIGITQAADEDSQGGLQLDKTTIVPAPGIASVEAYGSENAGQASAGGTRHTISIISAAKATPPVPSVAASNVLDAVRPQDIPSVAAPSKGGASASIAPITIGTVSATPIGSGVFRLPDGQILSAGGSSVISDGTTYSLGPSGQIVIDGSTVSTLVATQNPILTGAATPMMIGDTTATPVGPPSYVLPGGQILSAGGPEVTASGTTYSLSPSGAVIVNGQAALTLPSEMSEYSPVTFDKAVATPIGPSAYVLSGQTLSAGGSPVTVSGTTYSLSPSGGVVINGDTLSTLAPAPERKMPSAITIGGQILPVHSTSASVFVVDGQTLYPGAAPITITANGHLETLSLPNAAFLSNGGEVLIVNGQTETIFPGQSVITEVNGAILTITPTSVEELVVGGTTLIPGGTAITTDGAIISELPDREIVEVSAGKSSTIGTVGGEGVGSYIVSGIGGTSGTSTPEAFTGEGERVIQLPKWQLGIISVFGTIVFLL